MGAQEGEGTLVEQDAPQEESDPTTRLKDEAKDECDREANHVDITFIGIWAEDVRLAVLADLSAGLQPKQLSVCSTGQSSERTLAMLTLHKKSKNLVRIEVADALTNKDVARDILLQSESDGSAALIVAVAADELLRATWAELSFREKPPEVEPEVIDEPQTEPEPQVTPEPPVYVLPSHRLGARAAVDVYFGGNTLWGGDLSYGSHFADRVEWDVWIGPRVGSSKSESDLGKIESSAIALGLSTQYPLLRTRAFSFGPLVSLQGMRLWFRGIAPDQGTAASHQGWALTARGGASMRVQLGHMYVSLVEQLGYPIVGIEVTDGEQVVGGVSGLEWSSACSVGWWWK